jgi:hypothetical protein
MTIAPSASSSQPAAMALKMNTAQRHAEQPDRPMMGQGAGCRMKYAGARAVCGLMLRHLGFP